jgi:hypothetical protein
MLEITEEALHASVLLLGCRIWFQEEMTSWY